MPTVHSFFFLLFYSLIDFNLFILIYFIFILFSADCITPTLTLYNHKVRLTQIFMVKTLQLDNWSWTH